MTTLDDPLGVYNGPFPLWCVVCNASAKRCLPSRYGHAYCKADSCMNCCEAVNPELCMKLCMECEYSEYEITWDPYWCELCGGPAVECQSIYTACWVEVING